MKPTAPASRTLVLPRNAAGVRERPAKIIITGTGRAGTTLLVQLLTELGLDTGYTRHTWCRDYDDHCAAGLEHDATGENSPRILKNPAFCVTLPALLRQGEIEVEHVIIPIRDLASATNSRITVGGSGTTPGGLWGVTDAAQQKEFLAASFHDLVHTLVACEIPFTFLHFPRFAQDAAYARRQLGWLVGQIDASAFDRAFRRVVRPEYIHDYTRGIPKNAGEPARRHAQKRQSQARRRQIRRVVRTIFLIATIVALVIWPFVKRG